MKLGSKKQKMINEHLIGREIDDENVLNAFRKVPRELFVPPEYRHLSYNDSPLSIGEEQTISQPYIVALMMQLLELKSTDNILEIGTGSGYQTALLAEIVSQVFTIERIDNLMKKAKTVLKKNGYNNVHFKVGEGALNWSEDDSQRVKFNKIIVAAGAPNIPKSLTQQLAMGGKLIIPTGDRMFQRLIVVTRTEDGMMHTNHGGCSFVPLIGDEGWHL